MSEPTNVSAPGEDAGKGVPREVWLLWRGTLEGVYESREAAEAWQKRLRMPKWDSKVEGCDVQSMPPPKRVRS